MRPMTPKHIRWWEFVARLEGKEGCDFHHNEEGKTVWHCNSQDHTKPLARAILESMGDVNVDRSMEYFDSRGGYCDCEILFSCVDWEDMPEVE